MHIKDLIKKPYYYIPSCPCCESMSTGYYVKKDPIDTFYHVRQSYKNGEITMACNDIPIKNAFCLDCGFTWTQKVSVKYFSLNEIEEQKKIRGTRELYESLEIPKRSKLGKLL